MGFMKRNNLRSDNCRCDDFWLDRLDRLVRNNLGFYKNVRDNLMCNDNL